MKPSDNLRPIATIQSIRKHRTALLKAVNQFAVDSRRAGLVVLNTTDHRKRINAHHAYDAANAAYKVGCRKRDREDRMIAFCFTTILY